MKIVLFCGGLGMRMRDGVTNAPKPMAMIGDRPLIWHVMRYYAHFGHRDFVLCLGYGASVVKDFFLRYDETRSNDFVLEGAYVRQQGYSEIPAKFLARGVINLFVTDTLGYDIDRDRTGGGSMGPIPPSRRSGGDPGTLGAADRARPGGPARGIRGPGGLPRFRTSQLYHRRVHRRGRRAGEGFVLIQTGFVPIWNVLSGSGHECGMHRAGSNNSRLPLHADDAALNGGQKHRFTG